MHLLVTTDIWDIEWSLLKHKSPHGSQDELFK